MPQKRSNNRSVKNRRRGGKGGQLSSPFTATAPPSRRMHLAYTSTFSITESAATTGAYRVFRLNSLYDPDYTGIGTNAAGYAQMTSMFNAYRVYNTRVKVQGFSSAGIAVAGFSPMILQTSLPANPDTWRLIPGTKFNMIAPASQGGQSRFEATAYYSMPKLLNITRSQYVNEADFAAQSGTNPLRSIFLGVWILGPSGAVAAQTLYFTITIGYDVEFFDPVPMLQ